MLQVSSPDTAAGPCRRLVCCANGFPIEPATGTDQDEYGMQLSNSAWSRGRGRLLGRYEESMSRTLRACAQETTACSL